MALLAWAVIITVLLAACGGGTSLPGAQPGPAAEQGESQPASGGGATLAEIKKRGKVVVGTEAAFEPFEFVENGKIVGYGKDILTEVVKDMGVELEQLDLPFQGILPGLAAKKFDFVATSVTVLKERAEKYDFTLPIADSSYVLLVKKGKIKSLEEMNGKSAGTQLNSSGEPVVAAADKSLKDKGGKGFAEIKKYVGFPECYMEVANGRIDACFQALPNVAVLTKKQPDTYDIVPCPVCPKQYFAWVVRKGDTALRDQIDKTISRLHKEGKLAELQRKWFGFTMDLPQQHVNPTS